MKPVIKQYNDMDSKVWDDFVYNCRGGYAYYLYDVIALDRWINDKNRSFCIINEENGKIVLIAMLHLEKRVTQNDEFYRLHSRWGTIIDDNLTVKEKKKVWGLYKQYIDFMVKKYSVRCFDAYMPPLSENNWPGRVTGINPLMDLGFNPSIRYTWIVKMNKTEEELLGNCEQTTRQAIRKLRKSEKYVVVEAKAVEKDFQTYKKLHEITYTRTGAAEEIIYDEYNRNIFFNLIPQKRCRVFFLENKDGEAIATTVILLYKNTAYYWWGASVNDKEVGVNKYLLWESMIIVSKDYRTHPDMQYPIMNPNEFYFETGGAYTYVRGGKKKGLNDFKKCFGCCLHPIYGGEYVNK